MEPAAQHSTAQHSTAQHSTAQHSTAQQQWHNTAPRIIPKANKLTSKQQKQDSQLCWWDLFRFLSQQLL